MKKTFLLLPILLVGLYFSLTSYSSGPSTGGVNGTGATGTSGCGSGCHGSSLTSSTTVSITLDSAGTPVTHYVAGQTYNITITGTQTSSSFTLPKFGFQLTAVAASGSGSSSATNIGTLATSGLPTGCVNRTLSSLRLIEQSSPLNPFSGSGGAGTVYKESIAWTAPSTGSGTAKFYGVINAVNNNTSADAGDKWNYTNISVTEENAPITGTLSVCVSSTTSLSCATTGGTWTSGSSSVASVSTSGVVTGVSAGSAVISYATSLGTSTVTVAVVSTPSGGSITGPLAVCVGANDTLLDVTGTSGGTWSISPSVLATINPSTGVATGISAGLAHVTYTVTNACGTASATRNVTVNPLPSPGTITGGSTVCTGATLALNDTPSGGLWSSTSTSIATVNSSGSVLGLASGTSLISYTVTNGCGSTSATEIVTVNASPTTSAVAGPTSVCAGSAVTLSCSGTGGTGAWSTTTPLIATINSSGLVTGLSAGTAIFSYTVTSATCGSAASGYTVTVNPTPVAGAISGPVSLCVSSSITYTDTPSGGTWASSFPGIATVSSSGSVFGVATGGATLSYTVTSATCGSATATLPITVTAGPSAGTISGPSVVCALGTITLTDGASTGTWSSSNASIASVNTSGDVFGVSAGTATISYSVTTSCGTAVATQNVTVNPLPAAGTIAGPTNVCEAATITLTDTSTGGSWSCSPSTTATISTAGILTGVAAGSATVSYTVTNSCGIAVTTYNITVNPLPIAGTISGLSTVCVGSSISLSETATGGGWSSTSISTASVNASGNVTGLATGTTVISYTVTNGCGTRAATAGVTVIDVPSPGTISGPTSVCVGSSIALSETASGGTWGTTTSGITSVDGSGNVTGVATGAGVIKYTVTNTCGSANTPYNITVNPLPVAGTISGSTGVCVGSSITLSETATGGTWSTSASSLASVDGSGNVTGVGSGTATISYSVTNGCGTAVATYNVTSGVAATSGTISGSTTVCQGASTTYTDGVSGGTWSSSTPGIATVNPSTGSVTGVSGGSADITYTVSTGCSTAFTFQTISVTALPSPGTISGPTTVCQSATITLSDGVSGGTWSSSSVTTATISTSGVVTGVAGGTPVISYGVTNGCGTSYATYNITITPLPSAGTLTGPSTICTGTSTALGYTVMFGTWTTSAASIASVDASGNMYGVAVGSATISYTITNACGSASTTHNVTVSLTASAGAISGATSVCAGASTTLGESTTGGTWSSSAPGVASIDASGNVYGVSSGAATISYSVTTSCGTATATYAFTVNPIPSVSAISGATTVCTGASTTLTDASGGGTWTSTASTVASISTTGVVTGLTAGSTTISYTFTNACGTSTATQAMTVIVTPSTPSAITGATTVCAGASTSLTSATGGGSWSSANPGIASVDASGNVTGVSGGTTTISYTVSNACGSAFVTASITVNTTPTITAISGPSSVCVGAAIALTDATSGGSWSSSASSIASIDATGNVTGMAAGTATITYTLSSACGSAARLYTITVNTIPSAGTISGPGSVCPGATITLTDGVSGGVWSSATTTLATVNASTGVVTGIATGTTTISYAVTATCGTGYSTYALTINSLPIVSPVTGASTLCEGASTTLVDTTTGGSWGTSASTIASVNGSGVVTGTGGGTVNIFYSVTNVCGTASAAHTMTISPLPSVGIISGASSVCVGTVDSLTGSVSGGVWHVSNSHATITTSGILHAVSAGLDTVYHTFTNSCGSRSASMVVSVDAHLSASGITGPSSLCMADTAQLTVTVPGGTWSSSNLNATVSPIGVVTPVSAGMDTIMYTVSNACGSATAVLHIDIISAAACAAGVVTTAQNAEQVSIYPNPSNGSFTVVIPATGYDATITIVDVLGKTITSREVTNANGSTSIFNLTGVAAGSYLVKVASGNQNYRQTIVIY